MATCFDFRTPDLQATVTFIKTCNCAPIYKPDDFKELVKKINNPVLYYEANQLENAND
jgi:hypothetical protein